MGSPTPENHAFQSGRGLGWQSLLAGCVEGARSMLTWRRKMARVSARRRPERERMLVPVRQDCAGCGGQLRLRYENRRHLVILSGAVRLRLRIRWCEREGCPRF